MVASPFHHWSAKKNGCLGFQVYIYIYIYTHVFNWTVESLPLCSAPHFAHLISSQAGQHHMNISRCHGDGARNVVISRLTKWLGAVMHPLQQLSSLSTDVLVWNCLQKKPLRDASKLAACVRLSYSVSKVLKFGGPNPGRNPCGFWVDPWFRASKNTSELLNTGLPAGKSIANLASWRVVTFFENPVRTAISRIILGQQSLRFNKTYMSHGRNPPTFRYTAWFIGILILAYQSPHVI